MYRTIGILTTLLEMHRRCQGGCTAATHIHFLHNLTTIQGNIMNNQCVREIMLNVKWMTYAFEPGTDGVRASATRNKRWHPGAFSFLSLRGWSEPELERTCTQRISCFNVCVLHFGWKSSKGIHNTLLETWCRDELYFIWLCFFLYRPAILFITLRHRLTVQRWKRTWTTEMVFRGRAANVETFLLFAHQQMLKSATQHSVLVWLAWDAFQKDCNVSKFATSKLMKRRGRLTLNSVAHWTKKRSITSSQKEWRMSQIKRLYETLMTVVVGLLLARTFTMASCATHANFVIQEASPTIAQTFSQAPPYNVSLDFQ